MVFDLVGEEEQPVASAQDERPEPFALEHEDAARLEARTIDERACLLAHGFVARLRESHDALWLVEAKPVDARGEDVASEGPRRREARGVAHGLGDGAAERLKRVGFGRRRAVGDDGAVGRIAIAATVSSVGAKAPLVLRVDEQVVGDVHGATIDGLVAGGGAPYDGHDADAVVAAEDVVEKGDQRPELRVVDLSDDGAGLRHERREELEADAHHRAPLFGRPRVLVLLEGAPRVVRRIDVSEAKATPVR